MVGNPEVTQITDKTREIGFWEAIPGRAGEAS
jgi:hypothetical protein